MERRATLQTESFKPFKENVFELSIPGNSNNNPKVNSNSGHFTSDDFKRVDVRHFTIEPTSGKIKLSDNKIKIRESSKRYLLIYNLYYIYYLGEEVDAHSDEDILNQFNSNYLNTEIPEEREEKIFNFDNSMTPKTNNNVNFINLTNDESKINLHKKLIT